MLPWGHAALGYLVYSVYVRWRHGRPPIGLTVVALGIGTQFPDLIDKPLTWTVPLLPYGRSLAHSLVAFGILCTVLRVWFRYPDQRALTEAFTLGYATHVVGDGVAPALAGDYTALGYLFWPVTAVPASPGAESFIAFFVTLTVTPIHLFGIVLTVVAIALWIVDGLPGVRDLIREPTTTA